MSYVFILSTYQESGAEDVVTTLDRQKLVGLIEQNWPDAEAERMTEPPAPREHYLREHRKFKDEARARLKVILEKSDAELAAETQQHGGIMLNHGWGGMQLHVCELR
jgi:hypothetical protein